MLNIGHPHKNLFTKLTFELITLIFVIMSVCDYISMRYRISIYFTGLIDIAFGKLVR